MRPASFPLLLICVTIAVVALPIDHQLNDQPVQPELLPREATMEDAQGTVFGGTKREVQLDAFNGMPLIGVEERRDLNDQPLQQVTKEDAPGIVLGGTKRQVEDTSVGTSLIGVGTSLVGVANLVDPREVAVESAPGIVWAGTKRQVEDPIIDGNVKDAHGIVLGGTKREVGPYTLMGTSSIGVPEPRSFNDELNLVDGEVKDTQGFISGGTKREVSEGVLYGMTSDNLNKREVHTLFGTPSDGPGLRSLTVPMPTGVM